MVGNFAAKTELSMRGSKLRQDVNQKQLAAPALYFELLVDCAGVYIWRRALYKCPRWFIVPAARQLRLSFITTAPFLRWNQRMKNKSDLSASQAGADAHLLPS